NVGFHFSIKSSHVKVELHSGIQLPPEHNSDINRFRLKYKAKTHDRCLSDKFTDPCQNTYLAWTFNYLSVKCLLETVCDVSTNQFASHQQCKEACISWINSVSLMTSNVNNTRIPTYQWSFAVRGSVTLIIEDISIHSFEQTVYKVLKNSISKTVQRYCNEHECFTHDSDVIRPEHIIIQAYESHNSRQLYVSMFVKDPYHDDIGLTNDQFLHALRYNQQELCRDIKHQINLPLAFFEQQSPIEPVWIYGACLLALLTLVIIVAILRANSDPSDYSQERKQQLKKNNEKCLHSLLTTPIRSVDEEIASSTDINETESSNASNTLDTTTARTSCIQIKNNTSYFQSAIENVIRHRDDDPIPFIDETISAGASRKSSACWSERTSLSSRFGLRFKRLHTHNYRVSGNDAIITLEPQNRSNSNLKEKSHGQKRQQQ
ncbi:unnamed protein product, partial [Didymodactylos carnosus]